jgi:uncharacterized protein
MKGLKCQVLILKIASRCNLNCDYCYVYNVGDNTYLNQPKFMSYETVDALLDKVVLHSQEYELDYFEFIFHGGEPLLIAPEFYEYFIAEANLKLSNIEISYALQTNGVLLSKTWCELFERLNIRIGISIDGNQQNHDLHRKYHHGGGSYDDTIKGLRIAQNTSFFKEKLGILMVIDPSTNPLEVYQHLKTLGIKQVSFLLPYGNYEKLPLGLENLRKNSDLNITPYADWLLAIFEQWYVDRDVEIRIFRQIIELVLGIDNGFEYWGKRLNEFLVIETDGSIEAVGALKFCGNGFTKNGMNVKHNTLDESLQTPLANQYHQSHQSLCSKCENCPIVDACGGGFFANRYKNENGFDNPSIYCNDLMKMIAVIQNKVIDDIPDGLISEVNIEKISLEEIREFNYV